jgi:hypothetical protein
MTPSTLADSESLSSKLWVFVFFFLSFFRVYDI